MIRQGRERRREGVKRKGRGREGAKREGRWREGRMRERVKKEREKKMILLLRVWRMRLESYSGQLSRNLNQLLRYASYILYIII